MSDNDLIRRGDALRIMRDGDDIVGPDYPEWFINRYAAINSIPAASATQHDFVQPTVSPDVIEIDINAVMMEQIEEAAAQSPWVPPEYAMNEIISDCCSFLREPRDPLPDVAALVEAAEVLLMQHDFENPMRQADYHGDICQCRRCRMDGLRAALARVKGVM